MKRTFLGLGIAIFLSSALSGQAPATQPALKFDAADVHARPRGSNPNPQWSGGVLRGGRYDLRNATMVDLISMAYGIDNANILSGPNWLETDRFDIAAKAPQTTSSENIQAMLQALLADRFKLVAHKDIKPQPGFALTLGSGKHKMKEAKDAGDGGGCDVLPQTPEPGVVQQTNAKCHNVTMERFAVELRNMAGAYFATPVTDLTGLKGGWDFDLKFTQRALLGTAGSDGINMFDAVDKQLGLKLESRVMDKPVVIVDSVNQKPSDNPADIAKTLPSLPPAEFEVGTIKLSGPDASQPMGRLLPGGRIDLQGFTLKQLVTLAWDVNDEELVAAWPRWADTTRYSVVARPSADALGTATNAPPLDIDDVRLMMRALLVEKFKIKTHTEDRPVSVYALLSTGAPKLTKADPTNRSTWKNGPALGLRDPRDNNPILSRLVTCVNMSMSQLADALPRMAPGYIRIPVVDATGITGNFDFTYTFTPNGVGGIGSGTGGDGRGGGAPAPSASADPSGAVSLYDALTKQLGLRLDTQKRPLPVLVIDQINETPSED